MSCEEELQSYYFASCHPDISEIFYHAVIQLSLNIFLKFNGPEMKGSAFPRPCIWSHGFIYLPFQYNVILIGVICSEFRVLQLFSIFEVVCVKSASSVLLQIHLSHRTSLSNVLQALLQWVQPAWSNISLPYVFVLFPKPNNSYTIGWNSHCGQL